MARILARARERPSPARARKGVSPAVIILVLLAAIAIGFGLVDVNMDFNPDWKMIGIGAIAVFALLILVKPGMFKGITRRFR